MIGFRHKLLFEPLSTLAVLQLSCCASRCALFGVKRLQFHSLALLVSLLSSILSFFLVAVYSCWRSKSNEFMQTKGPITERLLRSVHATRISSALTTNQVALPTLPESNFIRLCNGIVPQLDVIFSCCCSFFAPPPSSTPFSFFSFPALFLIESSALEPENTTT